MTTIHTGLDIAKLNLQLDLAGQPYDLPNTPAGHRRLLKLLAQHPTAHVICEATGGYERDVVATLQQAQIPVSVLNPGRVRHFARATGQRAKTDRIDAAVLSAYGRTLQPKPTAARTPQEQQLNELIRRRVQLVGLLVSQRQQAERLSDPALRRQAQRLIRQLQRDIQQVESRLQDLQKQAAPLAVQVQKLTAITGVGSLTALSVLAELPELGTLKRQEAAALAGLAPRIRARVAAGKANVISAVVARQSAALSTWPPLVAARANQHLKAFYQRLRSAGKPAKVALTAVMRKLIVLMNHIPKNPNFVLQN